MTITSRIYPEPMEGAGTDSPQALLAGRTDAMMDGDEDSFVSVFVDKKVRVARLSFAEMSKVTWSNCTSATTLAYRLCRLQGIGKLDWTNCTCTARS